MARIPMSLRLEPDCMEELEYLSKALGVSKNQVVNLLIRQEYSKYNEDPKMKLMLEQLQEVRAVFEKYQTK